VVPINDPADLRHDVEKRLHVSPFNSMDQTYHFGMNRPGDHLALAIELTGRNEKQFRAGLRLTRLPITDSNLLKLFLAHPFVTMHVITGIHWQAFRLWLKGATYLTPPEPSLPDVTIVGNVRLSA